MQDPSLYFYVIIITGPESAMQLLKFVNSCPILQAFTGLLLKQILR